MSGSPSKSELIRDMRACLDSIEEDPTASVHHEVYCLEELIYKLKELFDMNFHLR